VERLKRDNVWDYYQNIFHPFVTDVFTSFALRGLPVDLERLEDLREVYHFAHGHLLRRFQEKVELQARMLLMRRCQELMGMMPGLRLYQQLVTGASSHDWCQLAPPEHHEALRPFVAHFDGAAAFNPGSKPQMMRWLFDVMKLQPIKSTDQKEKGIRSMSWEKVLALPLDKQALYKPATDKQSLEILAQKTPILDELLDVLMVWNICKAFLKEPTIDEETGELTRENGIFYHICSDLTLRCRYGTTESSRPKANSPNILNLPSFVHRRIVHAIAKLFRELQLKGELPSQFERYLPPLKEHAQEPEEALIPSVRSGIRARPGWCLVESDLQTAEIRGLAYKSGDKNLIRLMTEDNPSFGMVRLEGKKYTARLYYEAPSICEIPLSEQDPKVLYGVWKDKRKLAEVTEDMLLRGKDGKLLHPKYDLHWSLAEMVYCKPRELLLDKIERKVGKVGNFKTSYGGGEASLDRSIEADTGKKPEPGTSKSVLDALYKRQPRAGDYLIELENIPREKGVYVAESGRKRRFHKHGALSQDSWRLTKSILSAQGREMRNWPMQESVSATVIRACNWMLEFERNSALRGYNIVALYDSVVTHCPIEERFIWAEAHALYIHLANSWNCDGRMLRYPIDTEFNVGWSDRPQKDLQARWDDPTFEPVPPRLLPVLGWLRGQTQKYSKTS
jgi:hypothetical protein